MIVNKLYAEIHKIKGFLVQIELYTHRIRHNNTVASYLVVVSIIISSISSFCQLFLSSVICPCITLWLTFLTSLIAAFTAIMKEFSTLYTQPEADLLRLDSIYVDYTKYLSDMENLYFQYMRKEIDEIKLNKLFNKLSEGKETNETDLNRLCKKIKKSEIETINNRTLEHVNFIFQNGRESEQ